MTEKAFDDPEQPGQQQQPDPYLQLSDMPVGGLVPYAGLLRDEAPLEALGWLVADGRELRREMYPELYAALGRAFGSSGPGTFRLPNVEPMALVNADGDGFAAPYLIRTRSTRAPWNEAADA
ncbi:MAG: phage tail protein [Acidobacteriota bacterium]